MDFYIENGVLESYSGDAENVVIPSGVTSMGSSAFSSSRLERINCQAASRPDGWNEFWNTNRKAKVVWRYKNGIFANIFGKKK